MGADLYINSIVDAAKEQYRPEFEIWAKRRDEAVSNHDRQVAQAKVNEYWDLMYPVTGYFRDSYNDSNLLWLFDLSYWNDLKTDEDGNLPVEAIKELLATLTDREPLFEELLPTMYDKWSDDTPEEIEAYYREKYARLRTFLQTAVDLNEPIYCFV